MLEETLPLLIENRTCGARVDAYDATSMICIRIILLPHRYICSWSVVHNFSVQHDVRRSLSGAASYTRAELRREAAAYAQIEEIVPYISCSVSM
jgi:hypothetical protein